MVVERRRRARSSSRATSLRRQQGDQGPFSAQRHEAPRAGPSQDGRQRSVSAQGHAAGIPRRLGHDRLLPDAVARQAAAVGEQAIVSQHGTDAGQDGIVFVPELLYMGASAVAGNPSAIVVGRGNLAIQRDGRLQGYQRTAGAHEMKKGQIQFFGLGSVRGIDFHGNSGLAKFFKATAGNQRIGILKRMDTRYFPGCTPSIPMLR